MRSATKTLEDKYNELNVSIHALLAECDSAIISSSTCTTCFNPRTPCGVRRLSDVTQMLDKWFQSTHSLRSATMWQRDKWYELQVSIHALLAECDTAGDLNRRHFHSFNPRTPCGVRHSARLHGRKKKYVSIHALLAECDVPPATLKKFITGFNPRTPCGVRPKKILKNLLNKMFQSTHSLRSATDYRAT